MATNSLIQLTGSIVVASSGTTVCFPGGLSIELLSQTTSPPGWLGSASISNSGKFTIYSSIDPGESGSVTCHIYRDSEIVWQGVGTLNDKVVVVTMSEADYLSITQPDDDCCCINLSGTLRLGENDVLGVPVVTDDVVVKLNVAKFRDAQSVAQATLNSYGNFHFTLPCSAIKNAGSSSVASPCGCSGEEVLPLVFLSMEIGGTQVLKTDSFTPESGCREQNLHLDDSSYFNHFFTELETVSNDVTAITDLSSDQFYTITEEETAVIKEQSKISGDLIELLVGAAVISEDTAIIINHSYAICKARGTDISLWSSLDMDTLTDIINDAVSGHIVAQAEGIDDTFNKIYNHKIDQVGNAPTENGDTVFATLQPVMGTEADSMKLLKIEDSYGNDPEGYWQQVASQFPGRAPQIAQGLQTLAITGLQPEMTDYIIKNVLLSGSESPADMGDTLVAIDREGWLTMVNTVCGDADKLCIPKAVLEKAASEGTDPKSDYADKLYNVSQDVFPNQGVKFQIDQDSAFAHLFADQGTALKDFMANQPDFDFRVNNVWDISEDSFPGIQDTRDEITPVQNMMRLIGGNAPAISALMKAGLKSSVDIAAMGPEKFTGDFSTVLGGTAQAQQIYNKASYNNGIISNIQLDGLTGIFSSSMPWVIQDKFSKDKFKAPADSQTPDLETLFGNIDSCSCSDCKSMYSPAAYFTDILNFLQTTVMTNGSPAAYNELLRRRPDLIHIDLSCKNSNTPLPYTDLVNELLEAKIFKYKNPGAFMPVSYQTSLSAAELKAYPEHTYKDDSGAYQASSNYQAVYSKVDFSIPNLAENGILLKAIFPNTLPFHLPVEESRTYFNHLNFTRYQLMMQYRPVDYDTNIDYTAEVITPYNTAAEWLRLSKSESDIITHTGQDNIDLWTYYGFDTAVDSQGNAWYNFLFNNNVTENGTTIKATLKNILSRANITYTELLQVLDTNYLNRIPETDERMFVIISNDVNDPATCNLDKLTILYSGDVPDNPGTPIPLPSSDTIEDYILPFFTKLHRFLRLRRATGWSIYQLDIMLNSIGEQYGTLTPEVFIMVSDGHRIASQLNVKPEYLAGLWSKLDIVRYINFSGDNQNEMASVYDAIFRNKTVINPPDPVFDYDTTVLHPAFPFDTPNDAVKYIENKGAIIAATNISDSDLDSLFAFVAPETALEDIMLSWENVSLVFGLAQLASGLQISVSGLLEFFELYLLYNETPPPVEHPVDGLGHEPKETLAVIRKMMGHKDLLDKSPFSLSEFDFLIRNNDPVGAYVTPDGTIRLFLESLRKDLKKQRDDSTEAIAADSDTDTLGNIVLRAFSTQYGLEGSIVQDMLQDEVVTKDDNGDIIKTVTHDNAVIIPLYDDAGVIDKWVALYDVLTTEGFADSSNDIVYGDNNVDYFKITIDDVIRTVRFEDLYKSCLLCDKISLIVHKFGITAAIFSALLEGVKTTTTGGGTSETPPINTSFNLPDLRHLFVHAPYQVSDEHIYGADGYYALLVTPFENLSLWLAFKEGRHLIDSDFIDLLTTIITDFNITDVCEKLAGITGWADDDLEALLDGLNSIIGTSSQDDFTNPALFLQIADIMDSSGVLGLKPELVCEVLLANPSLRDAQTIRQAAKAKYTDDVWVGVAQPLQNELREKQRQALVAYMVAHPDIGDGGSSTFRWKDENDLYAYYLIDIDMKPLMQTSRIKQAISTAQLYVDRLILNLEYTNGLLSSPIGIAPDNIAQWESWRKWYRIWEANREVFLYPENWMDPTLRDDKTPVFKELETQLQQNEITAKTAEDALMGYLESLDKIAKLEPVTAYDDSATGIKHIIARNNAEPQAFYYRTLQNGLFSPWEKVNIDIKSDHVTCYVWTGRVYLFWLTFKAKQRKTWYPKPTDYDTQYYQWVNMIGHVNPDGSPRLTIVSDDNQDDKQTSWDIKLNWSQYKDGKWLPVEMCDEAMAIEPSQLRLTDKEVNRFNNTAGDDMSLSYITPLSNAGEEDLADLFRNRLFVSPFVYTDTGDPHMKNGALLLSLIFYSRPDEAGAITLNSFVFPDPVTKPYVYHGWEYQYIQLSPIGTRAKANKFLEITAGAQSAQRKLVVENVAPYKDAHFSYFYKWYKTNANGLFYYLRRQYDTGGTPLLDKGNAGIFRLTKFANATGGNNYHPVGYDSNSPTPSGNDFLNSSIIRDYFFYEDDVNTFYIQRNPVSVPAVFATESAITGLTGNTGMSGGFKKAVQVAGTNYPIASSTVTSIPGKVAGATSFVGSSLTIGGLNGSLQLGNIVAKTLFALYRYKFYTFYHAQIHDFILSLNLGGVDALLNPKNQTVADGLHFQTIYQPTASVDTRYPSGTVQFAPEDPYGIYNWEVFFHAPMLIAQGLSANQQFAEARKWYHYIFNPTSNYDLDGTTIIPGKKRFWKFYPFYEVAAQAPQTLVDLLVQINQGIPAAVAQVDEWASNPFNPYLIGRMRHLAFMKNVVMKYLDNLIAWGDQLFTQNTIESINEATQLYVLAANILGPKPEKIPRRAKTAQYTYQELLEASGGNLDALSNASVNIESFFAPNAGINTNAGPVSAPPVYGKMFYFCIPDNDLLLGYWDTIADRLFKIRNSMNIQGVVQQLPLYEPPINPMLLVKAKAMGVDIASIVDATLSSAAATSNYRFTYLLQKANEFCAEVRSLGASLLSALEKKDAEALALLRSSQEVNMLSLVTDIKQKQVDEAQANLDALMLGKEATQLRYDYYSSRQFTNSYEQQNLKSIQDGLVLQVVQAKLESAAGVLGAIPNVHIEGIASGISMFGQNLASLTRAASAALGINAAINNAKGVMASTMGGYQRRSDDWNFQAESAAKELEQMDQQILGAQIRLEMANKELSNHLKQLDDAQAVDDFMRNKFTNQELYSWMSNQVAATYFQSYQVAYDLARKVDACYKNELPVSTRYPAGGFISFGYWDSLRKGLLAGENLQMDLRRMEAAYLEDNVRELELTKHFSLGVFFPDKLMDLKTTGKADSIEIIEAMFDLDYPGQFLRRIKSVSISIPCVAGPYTTINCKLTQKNGRYRYDISDINSSTTGNQYKDSTSSSTGLDPRFIQSTVLSSIATSSAQNDSGVFELNFRDERYLPFENTGAIGEWSLEFPSDIRQFDLNTISDVIIHLKYVARDGGTDLQKVANSYVNSLIYNTKSLFPRYFSLKHEFSNEWYAGFNQLVEVPETGNPQIGHPMSLKLTEQMFPEYCKDKTITINSAYFTIRPKTVVSGVVYKMIYNNSSFPLDTDSALSPAIILYPNDESAGLDFIIYKIVGSTPMPVDENELVDLYFILNYKLS